MATGEAHDKLARLEKSLEALSPLAVAFSGGVDSTFLLAVAVKCLKDRVTAFTVASPLHPEAETKMAVELAKSLSAAHVVIHTNELELPEFTANTEDRCYVCKYHMLKILMAQCDRRNIAHLSHGANQDDLSDYRPGMRAAKELRAAAPLLEAGLSKLEIRALSYEMGLATWNKPAMACLASRIPYGTKVSRENLKQVEVCEELLKKLGFSGVRVRHHGPVARVEANPADFFRLISQDIRTRIIDGFKSAGFFHVSMDLEGYVSGAMNRELGDDVMTNLNPGPK